MIGIVKLLPKRKSISKLQLISDESIDYDNSEIETPNEVMDNRLKNLTDIETPIEKIIIYKENG